MGRRIHLASIAVLSILLFVISGCNQFEALKAGLKLGIASGKDRYVNKEQGISFKVPKGWLPDPSVVQGSKGENNLAAYKQNGSGFIVKFGEMPEGANLMLIVQVQSALLEKLGFYVAAQPKEVEINGRKAVEMALVGRCSDLVGNLLGKKMDIPDDPPYVALVYQIPDANKKKVYTLFLSTPQTEYDTTVKPFMEVVNSFQIS